MKRVIYYSLCLVILASCATSNLDLAVPFPDGANKITKQQWIKDKIDYLDKIHNQKVIEVKQDENSITFIFETEHMSSKVHI